MYKQPFYITTAISYPNGSPHIGHAYEVVTTDVIARFKRLEGYDVKFLTGTDDHGQKMFQTARNQNISPQELADQLTPQFENMAKAFNCSHDDFIRTSENRHHIAVQEIWKKMYEKGDIEKKLYQGWYCVREECFYKEDELIVDDNGEKIAPTGAEVEWVEEENYYFKLKKYENKLIDFYKNNPNFIQPKSRYNEIVNFINSGLEDLSISRTSFDWGVTVPNDPEHVVYVWVDALTNYLTALGYPDIELTSYYWPAALHVIGKDITRFHGVYWLAFLMSAELPLPKNIFAHGFLTLRGQKMSKSIGNVADPFNLIEKFDVDVLRYFFTNEINFGQDGSFSDKIIIESANAHLVNDLGNLAQRCLSMIHKNCKASIPQCTNLTKEDSKILEKADDLLQIVQKEMINYQITKYTTTIFSFISEINKYFAAQEPWALKKTNPERMHTILYTTIEALRQIAILLQPVIPDGSTKLLDLLSVPKDQRSFLHLGKDYRLQYGVTLPVLNILFPRLETS